MSEHAEANGGHVGADPQVAKESKHEQTSRISDAAKDAASRYASTAAQQTQVAAQHFVGEPAKDVLGMLRDYARQKPDVAAMWAFGLGIVVGWKLRP